jgi:hypothetical protein
LGIRDLAALERAFGQLSTRQLNWRPNEREWRIGQCFDHLIMAIALPKEEGALTLSVQEMVFHHVT